MTEGRNIFLSRIINNRNLVQGTMKDSRVLVLLNNLCDFLESDIDGDIVELGCFMGQTSILISQVLKYYNSNKKFYVYDSFEGLPERSYYDYIPREPKLPKLGSCKSKGKITKNKHDNKKKGKAKGGAAHHYDIFEWPKVPEWAKKGSLSSSMDFFVNVYKEHNLELPIINKGFFSDIDDNLYPTKIAFAFLDGDLYTSIYDSLKKIYFKVVIHGIIQVDDYEHPKLPGVKKACDKYLEENKISDKFVNIGERQGLLIKTC